MSYTSIKEKKIKDLTIRELKNIISESIAEDIDTWRETFEILADKSLMRQIKNAEKARKEGKISDFIPWKDVKSDV